MTPFRVARRAVLAALVLAPAVFLPPAADIFGLPKLVVIAVAVLVAVVALAVAPPAGRSGRRASARPVPRAAWFALAFLGAQALAVLASVDRWTSFFGAHERYGGLLPLALHLGMAALVVVPWRDDRDGVWSVAAAMALGGAVLATYVLCQAVGVDAIDWVEKSGAGVRYQAGSMGNSNFAAAYLGTVLPLLWPLARRAEVRWMRLATIALGLELAAALVATKGRGGLLAALVGGGVVLALAGPTRRLDWSRRRWAAVAGLLVVTLTAIGLLLATTTDVLRTESVDIRQREWAGAIGVFLDRPLLGRGPDTFLLSYPPHRTAADGAALGLQIADKPHDVLLELASGSGLIGLGAFLALVGAILVPGVAAVGRRERADRLLPAAFLGTAIGYLAQALFSFDVPGLASVWWVALAVVVLHTEPTVDAKRSPTRTTARWPWLVGSTASLAIVAVLGQATAADLVAGRALAGRGPGAVADAERALARQPHQPAYALLAGGAAEDAVLTTEDAAARGPLLARALAAYRHGLDQQPDNVLLLAGLARTVTLVGRNGETAAFAEADQRWKDALALDPYDWELHRGYGLMLNHWANAGAPGARERAADELRRTVALRPDQAATWSTLALVLESLGRADEAARAAWRGAALAPDDADARALAERLTRP
jgi:O-antigen ligase